MISSNGYYSSIMAHMMMEHSTCLSLFKWQRVTLPTDESLEPTEYLKLFAKQKKKKNGEWVDKASSDAYDALLKLHEAQLEEHGVDNLSTPEAFYMVLGHKSGYQKGMGEGPVPFKSGIHGGENYYDSTSNGSTNASIQVEVERQVGELMKQKEAELRAKLEVELRTNLLAEMRSMFQGVHHSQPMVNFPNQVSLYILNLL